MKSDKNSHFGICVWLGIISFILLCGVIIFAAYLYKFNPLSMFGYVFHLDKSIGWNALEAIGTIIIGIVTIWLTLKVSMVQQNQAKIQYLQNKLYIEPHIMIDSFGILHGECELTADNKEVKSIKNIDYPYFENNKEEINYSNFSVLEITCVNTSEAFARLRFENAIIKNNDAIIGDFNISTFGTHKNHIMLHKGESNKIGLVINNSTAEKLAGSEITLCCFLDNNYNITFKDKQSYYLIHKAEGTISFMPMDLSKNTYTQIKRAN